MMFDDSSEGGPRGTFETYRAEGDTLYKNGDYKKAIESYTTALEIKQGDKDCLVARSKCYLQLGDPQHALSDAETSLKGEPNFHKGLYQKAEALYCKGEFELALVFYHRGHKMRPELQEFRLGIQKAQEAIDNSVGSPEKVQLTKEGDLSFFSKLAEKPAPKKGRGKASYQRPPQRSREKNTNTFKSAVNDKTIKQLLGELYGDRVYLEKLLKETENLVKHSNHVLLDVYKVTQDPHSQTGRNIYDLVCDGIKYLDTRTEFWRQQKPMYARKRDRMVQQTGGAQEDKTAPNQYIIKELERIDEEQTDGRFTDSLKRAKKCLKTVEGYPEQTIPNRADVLANLHSCIGNAHLELGDLEKALQHHGMDMDIADKNDLQEAKSRALDNLGRVYARCGDYKKAIKVWKEKIPLSKSSLESTWLYHEIGRCYLEMDSFDEARECGEKSASAAEEAEDGMWQLNATVLVAQAEVKMNELQSALGSFEKALDMAKLQDDNSAKAAIKRAIEDVNNRIVQGIKKKESSTPEQNRSQTPHKSEKKRSETPPKNPTPKPSTPQSVTPKPPTPKPETPNPPTPTPDSPKSTSPRSEKADSPEKQTEPEDEVDGNADTRQSPHDV